MSKKQASEIDQLVGQRVRLFRSQRGYSQEALGKKINITFQQIQKYEKGTNRISVGKLYEIAEALEIDIRDFFDGLMDEREKLLIPFTKNVDIQFIQTFSQLPKDAQKQLISLANYIHLLTAYSK
jgi:transcriptional regulator with XRE-family HTH domain